MIFTCLFKFKGSHSSSLGSEVFRLQPLGPICSQHHLLTEMKTSEICSDFHKLKHVLRKFNFFLTNVNMCFHKYKQIVSQMPTCVFRNTNVSQTHKFIFTNTSKLCHICKHVSSQIQTDRITNTNVFTNKNLSLIHI